MKKIFIFIALLSCLSLFSFQIKGDPKSWSKTDFIGFDKIGDKTQKIGDISTLFAKIDGDKLYLRVTFDDMDARKHNKYIKDNFAENNITMNIKISNKKKNLKNIAIDISNLTSNRTDINYLRTPQNNLFEAEIPISKGVSVKDLDFDINVYFDDKISDNIQKSGKNRDGGGNCAFVHHGNQGLTYTEVFYGQYPQESSGFDEVLEVHQATGIPGNFHMSGTLMPAAAWHNPEFNNWLKQGVTDGWAAMVTSALGQHIMPFVNNDMNNWSVKIETDMIRNYYNYNAKVAWVPERVWLSPDQYPNSGVSDWIGDNWTQYGVNGVILDDWPHLSGANNEKIHWMNNSAGVNLRLIPIDNDFVGKMHYDRDGAKNLIANTGQYQIAVYGTDWEVAAEMNENHNTSRLDNYEDVLWWCNNNYPAVNVWKLDSAMDNSDFNGSNVDITNGTYGMLGGADGYGGSNNSWYNIWAGTASHSDFHNPKWNYGYIWSDAYNNLTTAPDNSLSQLGWYTMMINLHETGWQESGEVASWEHRYSSHIKNSNVYTEASRWAAGQYATTTAAYFSDIDHDNGNELVMYNDKVFAVFEGIGGKINWLFYKDGYGNAYSVVSSDMTYWSETDGDYNEAAYNHFAALSDVNPDQQSAIYQMNIDQSTGDAVQATLSQWGVKKTIRLETGKNYLDVIYDFFGSTGYIKSGFSPDLLDLLWSGKSHLQRLYGDYAKYAGWRNSASGASVAYVLGSAGGNHSGEFEGTLVKGDEIYGTGLFSFRLFAGYTSQPYGTGVTELNELADETTDLFGPRVESAQFLSSDILIAKFNETVEEVSAEDVSNYTLSSFSSALSVISAKLTSGNVVILQVDRAVLQTESGTLTVNNVKDLDGNITDTNYNVISNIGFIAADKIPHLVGTMNGWSSSDHTYDFALDKNGVWKLTANLNSGNHEYKVIESESWNGNDWPSTNQTFSLSSTQDIVFYVNAGATIGSKNGDEFVFHSPNPPVATGDFLSELGGTDWDSNSTITQMNDSGINGDETADDGIFSYATLIPQGTYSFKIVLNNNWDQNTSGSDFSFTSDGVQNTLFTYDMSQNSTGVSQVTVFTPPSNLTAQMSGESVLLNWEEPSAKSLTSYKIYRNDIFLDSTTANSYIDSTATDGITYSYKVTAVYSSPSGESDYSNEVSINCLYQHQISGVEFWDKNSSTYSNVADNEILASGSSVLIEAKVYGADINSNSDFSVTLYYSVDNDTLQTKSFDWYSNSDTLSYWRVELSHNIEIQNGDSIRFYIETTDYTANSYIDNDNGNYYNVNILGIAQPVTVTFKLNLGGIAADSVAIMGSQEPLDWAIASTIMSYDSTNIIYQASITFPESSSDTTNYKYGKYSNEEWSWEAISDNRTMVINDSSGTQILDTDNWSDYVFPDLYGVTFLDSTASSFTNFADSSTVEAGSSLNIEAEIDGYDSQSISGFYSTLYYKINSGDFSGKSLYWQSNDTSSNKSYWQTTLANGTEISNGDTISFYISAGDYNGPVIMDDNDGTYYSARVSTTGISQDSDVTFNVNLGAINADSLAVFGSDYPLDWTIPIYLTDGNSDKIFDKTVTFSAGSNREISYKYKRFDSFEQRWIWETIDNRSLSIDSISNTTNDTWNNLNIEEVTAITFLPDSLSDYTNFNNGETLTSPDSVLFETMLDNADYDAVSGFYATLYYKLDSSAVWETKEMAWYSNSEDKSYWRCALNKSSEIGSEIGLTFYLEASDYTGTVVSDNNGGVNYTLSFAEEYTNSAVTVKFSLDLVTESADSVCVMGNVTPLSWQNNSNIMSLNSSNYEIYLTFASGSNKNVEYKYKIYQNGEWIWENSSNRSFIIDDSSPNQVLPLDYWNNGSLAEISGVIFLDSATSSYTNFANGDTLVTGSTVYIEAQIDGVDANANSEFNVILYYTINDTLWFTKSFDWASNDTSAGKSYWKTTLENGAEISNGDSVKFYIKATDYTQNQYIDDNGGSDYVVYISNSGITRDVKVTFNLNMGTQMSYNLSIQGNTSPLDWNVASNPMTDEDGNKIYNVTLLFPSGSNKSIEYKYVAYYNEMWNWENFSGNRYLVIDDSDSLFDAGTDYWNKMEVAEISGVHFLEKSYPSEYTNFDNGELLNDADTLKFEAEVLGADENSNSDFNVTLHYKTGSTWQEKAFSWYSNLIVTKGSNDRSYWRIALIKNVDFSYGDEVKFYVTAIDYNGEKYSDKSALNPYTVSVGKPAAPINVIISHSNGNIILNWDAVTGISGYNVYRSQIADSGFTLWQTNVTATSITDSTAVSSDKYFYYIKSVK